MTRLLGQGQFDAAKFAADHIDDSVKPEQILAKFPPDTAQKIADVTAKLAKVEQTIETFKKDGKWTPDRLKLHQKIAAHILSDAVVAAARPADGEQPTFNVLGGRGGSGKSWFKDKVYDPAKAVVLDADEIKQMLPEYKGWNAAQVHEESSEIFDQITAQAQALKLNVVHDSTMKTGSKAVDLIKRFKGDGYRAEAHYMFLPPAEAATRAVHRFLGPTQRFVPPGIVLGNRTNEKSFDDVKGLVDNWSFRDNNVAKGAEPRLISESKHEADGRESGRDGQSAAENAGGAGEVGVQAKPADPEADRRAEGQGGREPLGKAADRGGVGRSRLLLKAGAYLSRLLGSAAPASARERHEPTLAPPHVAGSELPKLAKADAAEIAWPPPGARLLVKAKIKGGAGGDLFGDQVMVKPYVRAGKMVEGHVATRHKSTEHQPVSGRFSHVAPSGFPDGSWHAIDERGEVMRGAKWKPGDMSRRHSNPEKAEAFGRAETRRLHGEVPAVTPREPMAKLSDPQARSEAEAKRERDAAEMSPAAKHFYVSAIDGKKRHLVAGPYAEHGHALAQVDAVRSHAEKVNPEKAHPWMAWGTAGSENPIRTPLGENWGHAAAADSVHAREHVDA